jgi:tRNA threonylcarbamoyl adenosine modification protein YeaZ
MTWVAVVDTSTPAVTAAVIRIEAGRLTEQACRRSVDARAHGELLAPALAGALEDAGITPADLAAIVAGTGPGPFTGLRVGLVTAAVLGQTLGIPTYGVCSLDGIGAATTGRTLVATDARRKEVYWASYQDGRRVDGPSVSKPSSVDTTGYDRAVGAGAAMYDLGLPVLAEPQFPVPLELARLATDRILAHGPGEPLTPLYLRRPDAVEPGVPKPVRL